VNAAALAGQRLLATHSEVGLLSWPIEGGAMQPLLESKTAGARTVRFITSNEDGWVWLTADDIVYTFRGAGDEVQAYRGAGSPISALVVDRQGVFAGTQAGDVWRWPPGRASEPEQLVCGAGRAVGGLSFVETGGIGHLVYADGSAGLHAKVLGDSYVCRYESGGPPIVWALAGEDLLIGVNDPPDTLVLWRPHEPAEPITRIPVGRQASQFLRDVDRWAAPAAANQSPQA
jgi:hypothetical protein